MQRCHKWKCPMLLRALVGRAALRHAGVLPGAAMPSQTLRQLGLPVMRAGDKRSAQTPLWMVMPHVRGLASSSSSSARRAAQEKARREDMKQRNRRAVIYLAGVAVAWLGISYAAVPLYKIFCQMTGFGGTTRRADEFVAEKLTPRNEARPIRITFDGGVSGTMPWSFRPQQRDLLIVPGETALAFYTAKNKTDKPITGVATYNVYPPQTGVYFNKIQCFCFEEQRLKANEEIDMPVFFFIDPEFCDDPSMSGINNITLSYTFFKTDDVSEEEVGEDDE